MSVARFDEISADIRDRAVDMLRATASKRVILHADVTKVKLQPGTMAQVAEEWRRDLLPAMQGHAGYRGAVPHCSLTGRSKDEGYAIVLFGDASDPAEVHSDANVGGALGSLLATSLDCRRRGPSR